MPFPKSTDPEKLQPEPFLSGGVLVMLGWNIAVKNLKSLFWQKLALPIQRSKQR